MEKKQMNSKSNYIYDDEEYIRKGPKHSADTKRVKKKKKKKSKAKRIIMKTLIILMLILILLFVGIIAYGFSKLGKIKRDDSFDKNDIEINEGVETTGYMNLYLFGVDARDQNNSYKESLSDVIMVVSINQDTKKVKIASVYRDTYLQDAKLKKFDKITHSFLRGGPSLSMSSLNTNLDLDITDYVAINFNVVIDVVDAVGGIELDISKEEAREMKNYITEMNNCTGHNSKYIEVPGLQLVDGVQATAYARQRYTGAGDWDRAKRQREVLNLVFEKMKKMNITQLNKLADTVLEKVSTNIETKQILYLITQAASYEVEETVGWPYEVADYEPQDIWYGVPRNLEKQVVKLHEYLFEKENYQVSSAVKNISDKMIRQTGIK